MYVWRHPSIWTGIDRYCYKPPNIDCSSDWAWRQSKRWHWSPKHRRRTDEWRPFPQHSHPLRCCIVDRENIIAPQLERVIHSDRRQNRGLKRPISIQTRNDCTGSLWWIRIGMEWMTVAVFLWWIRWNVAFAFVDTSFFSILLTNSDIFTSAVIGRFSS